MKLVIQLSTYLSMKHFRLLVSAPTIDHLLHSWLVENGVPDVAEVTADFHQMVTNVHGGLA